MVKQRTSEEIGKDMHKEILVVIQKYQIEASNNPDVSLKQFTIELSACIGSMMLLMGVSLKALGLEKQIRPMLNQLITKITLKVKHAKKGSAK